MTGREYVVSLSSRSPGLLLCTRRFAEEIREADRHFEDVKDDEADRSQIQMLLQLIESISQSLAMSEYNDRYQSALLELIPANVAGSEPTVVQEAAATAVYNLLWRL